MIRCGRLERISDATTCWRARISCVDKYGYKNCVPYLFLAIADNSSLRTVDFSSRMHFEPVSPVKQLRHSGIMYAGFAHRFTFPSILWRACWMPAADDSIDSNNAICRI